jgi:hypothetical protein
MVMIVVRALVVFCVITFLLSIRVNVRAVEFSFKDIAEMSDKDVDLACKSYPQLAIKIRTLKGINNITEKYNSQIDQFYDNIDNYNAKNILALHFYINTTKELIREQLLSKVDSRYFKKRPLQSDKSWFFNVFDKNQLALIYSNIELIDKLLDGEDFSKIDIDPIFERHYDNIKKLKI